MPLHVPPVPDAVLQAAAKAESTFEGFGLTKLPQSEDTCPGFTVTGGLEIHRPVYNDPTVIEPTGRWLLLIAFAGGKRSVHFATAERWAGYSYGFHLFEMIACAFVH